MAIEIARASQYWSILQVQYTPLMIEELLWWLFSLAWQISAGATSPSLSDRNHFRYFFRTVAPDHSHNDARAVLFKHYGWSHVGTLSENTESYALAMNELVRVLGKHHNITVVSSGSIGELKIKAHLQLLKACEHWFHYFLFFIIVIIDKWICGFLNWFHFIVHVINFNWYWTNWFNFLLNDTAVGNFLQMG